MVIETLLLLFCYLAPTRTRQTSPSDPMSVTPCFVVPCGVRLSEVRLAEFRKPQVAGSIPVAGSILSIGCEGSGKYPICRLRV